MKNSARLSIIAGSVLVGFFFGNSMGLAFNGGAINLGFTFGTIFGLAAFFATWSRKAQIQAGEIEKVVNDVEAEYEPDPQEPLDQSISAALEKAQSLSELIAAYLCKIWNFEMQILLNFGMMPTIKRFPWTLGALAIVLLLFMFPVGVFYVAIAIAALTRSPKSVNDFKVI